MFLVWAIISAFYHYASIMFRLSALPYHPMWATVRVLTISLDGKLVIKWIMLPDSARTTSKLTVLRSTSWATREHYPLNKRYRELSTFIRLKILSLSRPRLVVWNNFSSCSRLYSLIRFLPAIVVFGVLILFFIVILIIKHIGNSQHDRYRHNSLYQFKIHYTT